MPNLLAFERESIAEVIVKLFVSLEKIPKCEKTKKAYQELRKCFCGESLEVATFLNINITPYHP